MRGEEEGEGEGESRGRGGTRHGDGSSGFGFNDLGGKGFGMAEVEARWPCCQPCSSMAREQSGSRADSRGGRRAHRDETKAKLELDGARLYGSHGKLFIAGEWPQ